MWREEEGSQAEKGDEPPATAWRQARGVVKRPMELVSKVPVRVLQKISLWKQVEVALAGTNRTNVDLCSLGEELGQELM